jgi:hypothetical protein
MAIILPSGFNITNNEPVDARITLADQTARYALSSANVYEGLIVFQQDNNTIWVLTDTTNVGNSNGWTQLQIGSVSSNLPEGVVSGSSQLTSSFARLGAVNTFTSNQTISGSLTVTQDFVVLGSSSIQHISSSTLNIGTNLITVAVNQPSVRFGGIAVIDSGSAGQSGSFLYDALQDEFIFVHRGNGTNVTSSHFVLGPETYDDLGNETYLTNNRVPKGSGKEHLNDSNITDTGTLITLGSNSVVNGTFYATGTTLISGSSQVSYPNLSNIPAGIVSGSSQVISILTELNTFSASAKISITNIETFTSSANTRLGLLETSTGSLNTFTSSINTTIKDKLNTDGVVSGSSQINVASTTGDIVLGTRTSGNYVQTIAGNTTNGLTAAGSGLESADVTLTLAQSIKTDANPQFNSLGIGTAASTTAGEIRATGDITAFYSSDIRLKENIQPIQNALEKVESISGNTYDWKEGYEEIHSHKGNDVGVIAQEIEEILPQIVTNRDNGYKAVQYEKIIPLLIEAIKELSARVNILENK